MDKTGTGTPTAQAQNADSTGADQTEAVTTYYQNPRSRLSRTRVQSVNNEPSMTDASQGNDTDVNTIIARFDRTGVLPLPTQEPQYADCVPFNRDLTELLNEAQDIQARAQNFIEQWSPTPEVLPQTSTQNTESVAT
ncbi:MAG: internal scaffolding protein [Microviridae sp.]|nr:MAG: internal scaffolding protein [Microviridae sp.]